MATCESSKGLLLDYLYGLLDEPEAGAVRMHLESCPACQAAHQEAQKQQQLFARAARVPVEIPEFMVPAGDVPVMAAETPVAQTDPVTMPAPTPRKKSRFFLYVSWTVAVAVLLAVGLTFTTYARGLAARQLEVAEAKQRLDSVTAQLAATQVHFQKSQQQLSAELKREFVQLQLAGPAQVHPDAPAPMHLKSVDLEGKPAKASVQVNVVDQNKKTVYSEHVVSTGDVAFQLPKGLQGQQLTLVVQDKDNAAVQIKQPLGVTTPSYVTHLALNKNTYNIGELLFFRTLTLENFSLKPAAANLPLRYALVDLQGNVVKQLDGVTGQGGIAGGEFALTTDIPSGMYRLEVMARDGAKILPQSRRVEIVRDATPQVATDKAKYLPGQDVNLSLHYRGKQSQAPVANKAITVQPLTAQGQPQAAPQQLRTDAKGTASFKLQEKFDTNRAVVEIQVHDGKPQEKLVHAIPVVPSSVIVDFFPEGGDLVEGLPTRVYYRVQSPTGEPVDQPGRVVISSSTAVIHDSQPRQGTGVFTLTPRQGETYTVRITSPSTEILAPFGKLGIRNEGVVLSVPNAVSKEGEAVNIALGNRGKIRNVLVLATCRGQIVSQRSVTLAEGQTKLELSPVAGAAGVLRITVFEATENQLMPLAERLVYRVPARRLDVTATTAGQPVLRAGQHVDMTIKGQNEKMQPETFWSLVAVVDERFRPEKERSLQVHFFLAGDLKHPENLEQMHLTVSDDPQFWPALDLFLGTEGWRRFVATPSPPVLAKLAEDRQAGQGSAAFFQQHSASAAILNRQYHTKLMAMLAQLRGQVLNERADLAAQKEMQEQNYRLRVDRLADFEQLPQEYLRLAGGAAIVLSLLAAGVLIVVGLIRIARKRESIGAFGGGLVAAALCLLLYMGLRTAEIVTGVDNNKTAVFAERKSHDPLPNADTSSKVAIADQPVGQFALAGLPKHDFKRDRANANFEQLAPVAKAEVVAMGPAPLGGAGASAAKSADSVAAEKERVDGKVEMQKRFLDAKRAQEQAKGTVREPVNGKALKKPLALPAAPKKDSAPPPAFNTSPAPTAEAKMAPGGFAGMAADQDGVVRQYAFRRAKNSSLSQGTVLWHPILFANNGQAQVSFDLGSQPTSYRVLIFSNTADGRLGFHESTLQVQP